MGNENYTAIIGPPRSGTSWLHKYLKQHPSVFSPHIKEINWFNIQTNVANPAQIKNVRLKYEETRDRRTARGLDLGAQGLERKERFEMRDDAGLKAFFQKRVQGDMPYFDVSPGYAALPADGFQRIADTFSGAKLVLMLRNPADRAWSLAHHARKRHAPDADIDDVIAQLDAMPPTPLSRNLHEIYDTARRVFDAGRILCLFTEELFAPHTQQDTVDRLSKFVNVAAHPIGSFEFSKNRGIYDEMPEGFRRTATQNAKADIDWARALMGQLPATWDQDITKHLNG